MKSWLAFINEAFNPPSLNKVGGRQFLSLVALLWIMVCTFQKPSVFFYIGCILKIICSSQTLCWKNRSKVNIHLHFGVLFPETDILVVWRSKWCSKLFSCYRNWLIEKLQIRTDESRRETCRQFQLWTKIYTPCRQKPTKCGSFSVE